MPVSTDDRLHGTYSAAIDPHPAPVEVPNDAAPEWTSVQRVGFRFAVVYFGLYMVQPLLIDLPFEGWSLRYATFVLGPTVAWTGRYLFGITHPVVPTDSGSGDTTFDWLTTLCLLVIAIVATIAWSARARQRSYPRLHAAFQTAMRFAVSATMLYYGFVKVIPGQFPAPLLHHYTQPFGSFSPMGVLWTVMGSSRPYTIFGGMAECVAGVLLLVRRTTTLGALVTMAVMANVVMLNLSFDVCVKLFAIHLLLIAVVRTLPDARRLANVLILNRATTPAPEHRVARTARGRAAGAVVTTVFVGMWIVAPIVQAVKQVRERDFSPHTVPLYGLYEVTTFERNGAPATVQDTLRWRRIAFEAPNALWARATNDSALRYGARVDTTHRSITVRSRIDSSVVASLSYTRVADGLDVVGRQGADSLRMHLRAIDMSQFLLIERGFHWINETPFIR